MLMHNILCLYRAGSTELCAGAAGHALCMEDFQRLLQQHLGYVNGSHPLLNKQVLQQLTGGNSLILIVNSLFKI